MFWYMDFLHLIKLSLLRGKKKKRVYGAAYVERCDAAAVARFFAALWHLLGELCHKTFAEGQTACSFNSPSYYKFLWNVNH